MHKSKRIIYVNPKFMINSQDVYFGITRQCAQVGLKNINTFNKKNHLCRSSRDRKIIYGERRRGAAPAVRLGGRRDDRSREAAARFVGEEGRRAMVEAREGGGSVARLEEGLQPELVAAGCKDAAARRGATGRGVVWRGNRQRRL
jgi:hypothetical protein